MTLLAITLGIKTNRSDTALHAGMALLLCLGYYFIMVLLSWLDEKPRLRPDILVWIPNVVLVGLGIFLFNRAEEH
jgi:lipopolysaccharide export system permease protein